MITIDVIRRIEEASFNAWPALNVMLYDGWLLRFANGYTKRANSINGLYQGALPIETKIDNCQAVYVRLDLRPIFRLTPLINPADLDHRLQARDYKRIDHTSVQLLDLNKMEPERSKRAVILSGHDGIDSWLRSFHTLNPQRSDAATHEEMLNKIMAPICLMVLIANKEVAACGLAVADGDYLGLFDIVTAVENRRQGYGLELTSALLAWGLAMKTRYAYLQVMTNNEPAKHLYDRLGFQEVYRYWYRVAPNSWRSYE
jgi:ribosomal protein S18 acetylase RimI-like enzyme